MISLIRLVSIQSPTEIFIASTLWLFFQLPHLGRDKSSKREDEKVRERWRNYQLCCCKKKRNKQRCLVTFTHNKEKQRFGKTLFHLNSDWLWQEVTTYHSQPGNGDALTSYCFLSQASLKVWSLELQPSRPTKHQIGFLQSHTCEASPNHPPSFAYFPQALAGLLRHKSKRFRKRSIRCARLEYFTQNHDGRKQDERRGERGQSTLSKFMTANPVFVGLVQPEPSGYVYKCKLQIVSGILV